MQTRNRILDDMARVASGALGTATGLRGEVEALKAGGAKSRKPSSTKKG